MSYFNDEEDLHEEGLCAPGCRFCEMEDSVEDSVEDDDEDDCA